MKHFIRAIRWQLSIAAWWLWLKVTPEHPFKRAILEGMRAAGNKYRRGSKKP